MFPPARLTLTILLLAEGHVLDDCDVPGTSLIQRSLSISALACKSMDPNGHLRGRIPKWYGKGGNRKHDGFSNVKAPSHLSQGPSYSVCKLMTSFLHAKCFKKRPLPHCNLPPCVGLGCTAAYHGNRYPSSGKNIDMSTGKEATCHGSSFLGFGRSH